MLALHSLTESQTRQDQHGFTVIELMVVVAIVAILATLAAPSFNPLIERWRVRSASEDLTSTLYFARSEAIKRGGGITIDATGGWNLGWKVIHASEGVSTVLQTSAPPQKIVLTQNNNKNKLYVDRWGMLSETDGGTPMGTNLVLYPEGKTATDNSSLRVCVSGGRIVQMKYGAACP